MRPCELKSQRLLVHARQLFNKMTLVFKVVLIGDSGVGKTSVLGRLLGEQFNPTFICTTPGEVIRRRKIGVKGKQVQLEIWDAPGNENFRTVSAAYLKDAKCVLLFFDVSKEESFGNVDNWMAVVDTGNTAHSTSKILIGNKTDKKRCVSKEEAEHKAERLGSGYIETSAKNNNFEDFKKIFEKIAIDVLEKSPLSQSKPGGPKTPSRPHWYNSCILL